MGHKSAPNCVTFVGAVEGIFLTGPKISPTVCVGFSQIFLGSVAILWRCEIVDVAGIAY